MGTNHAGSHMYATACCCNKRDMLLCDFSLLFSNSNQLSSQVVGRSCLSSLQTTKLSHTFPQNIIGRFLAGNLKTPAHASNPDTSSTTPQVPERIHSSSSDCICLQINLLEYIPITQRKQIHREMCALQIIQTKHALQMGDQLTKSEIMLSQLSARLLVCIPFLQINTGNNYKI